MIVRVVNIEKKKKKNEMELDSVCDNRQRYPPLQIVPPLKLFLILHLVAEQMVHDYYYFCSRH